MSQRFDRNVRTISSVCQQGRLKVSRDWEARIVPKPVNFEKGNCSQMSCSKALFGCQLGYV